jgi:G:T-mismatch repair DNA endonuclease (very short patch repair protein)
VVFCDGDFWHGRNWQRQRDRLLRGTNGAYWIAKIEANIERDKSVTTRLQNAGWRVIRVWETEVKEDRAAVASSIADAVRVVESETKVPGGDSCAGIGKTNAVR